MTTVDHESETVGFEDRQVEEEALVVLKSPSTADGHHFVGLAH
jgi:hypothetical protein